MAANKNTVVLNLFTNSFPFGKAEGFLYDEVIILAERFPQINIFPLKAEGELRSLPANIAVKYTPWQVGIPNLRLILSNFFLYARIILKEFFHTKYKLNFIKNFREHSSILLQCLNHADNVCRKYPDEMGAPKAVFYSYWLYEWATVLGIMKEKKKIKGYVSRAHSYDIYSEYFRKDKIIPFQYFQMTTVSHVYTDSQIGADYLKQKYFPGKASVRYLGTKEIEINPHVKNGTLKIISCSFLDPFKRVWLIPEVLSKLAINVHWTHIGDGEQFDQLVEKCGQLPSNIRVELKGYMGMSDIEALYRETPFDCFIHLSEQEGLPVAIITAVSAGIPIIATDAGGVKEIVNERTGVLLPVDVDLETVEELLRTFTQSRYDTGEFRGSVRKYWEDNFSSMKNFSLFADELMSLAKTGEA